MKRTLLTAALLLAAHGPASAHDGHDHSVVRKSACGSGIRSTLKAGEENGRIEVEYEIENALPGDLWKFVLRKNGKVILRTQRRVSAAAVLGVRVLTPNGNGNDRISAKATRAGSVGTCESSVVVAF